MHNRVHTTQSICTHQMLSKYAKAIPFFFFVSCRMRFLILGRSVGKEKKKTKIKLKRSLEIDGLVPQHNIREAWKQQGVVAKSTWRQW